MVFTKFKSKKQIVLHQLQTPKHIYILKKNY